MLVPLKFAMYLGICMPLRLSKSLLFYKGGMHTYFFDSPSTALEVEKTINLLNCRSGFTESTQ